MGVALHVFLLPLKAALHYTIVDVRARTLEGGRATLSTANGSAVACVVWLALLSYCMCTACGELGRELECVRPGLRRYPLSYHHRRHRHHHQRHSATSPRSPLR